MITSSTGLPHGFTKFSIFDLVKMKMFLERNDKTISRAGKCIRKLGGDYTHSQISKRSYIWNPEGILRQTSVLNNDNNYYWDFRAGRLLGLFPPISTVSTVHRVL